MLYCLTYDLPGGIPNKIPTCYEASLPFPVRFAPSFLTDEHFTWQPSCIGIFPQHVGPFLDFSEVYGAFVMQLHNLLLDRLLSLRILTNLFAAQRTVKNEHAESDSIFVELIGDRCLRSSRSWRTQCFTFGKQCGIIVLLNCTSGTIVDLIATTLAEAEEWWSKRTNHTRRNR